MAPALATERDYVLQWIPPGAPVDGYRVLLGQQSLEYSESIELGFISSDPDGIARTGLILDSTIGYYVVMTAYNQVGESGPSNEIFIPASACDPSACDDGDPCTADDCLDLQCAHVLFPEGTICGASNEVCLGGACIAAECLEDADCSNGDVCDGLESCRDFFCATGTPLLCLSDSQCRSATCDPQAGCTTHDLPDGTTCSDGASETLDDQCTAGECVGHAVVPECLADVECADGNTCNGEELCAEGICHAGTPPSCGEPTQCANPYCDPVLGCTLLKRPDGTACDDGSKDTYKDRCLDGLCVGQAKGEFKGQGKAHGRKK